MNYRIIKLVLVAMSFWVILFLGIFIHEFSHAITTILLGGVVEEFVITSLSTGHCVIRVNPDVLWLVAISGGLGQALFYKALMRYNKMFFMPALAIFTYAIYEIIYLVEHNRFMLLPMMQLGTLTTLLVIVAWGCMFASHMNSEGHPSMAWLLEV